MCWYTDWYDCTYTILFILVLWCDVINTLYKTLHYMTKWPLICSTCRKHFPVLSSLIIYHRSCSWINTTDATSGALTASPAGAPEFTPVFSRVRVTQSLVWCVCFIDSCLSFCAFLLAIVLSVLHQYTDSDYPFGIFKFFLSFLLSLITKFIF
jgi:hypothetical protein